MNEKEFKKKFKKEFGVRIDVDYEEIYRFLGGLDLNFDIYDLSSERDFWYEARIGIRKAGKCYEIVFDTDF